jgi:hypothetical protein
VPGEPVRDEPGERWPDQRWQHPGRRHEAEDRRSRPLGVDRRDRHEHRDELRPGARPLQHPPDEQLREGARGSRGQQPDGEDQRGDDERRPRAGDIAPAPAEHRAEHRRGEERREGPGVGGDRAEVVDDSGHRGADAHGLESRDEGQEYQADGRRPPSRAEELGADGGHGLCGRLRHGFRG